MGSDPLIPDEVLDEAILAAARAWCQTRFDYEGAEDLERDAIRTAEDPALQSAVAFAAPILYAAGRADADWGRPENAFTRDWPAEWVEATELAINDCRCRNDGLRDTAIATLVALTEAGALQPPGAEPDLWQYAMPAEDEPDGVMPFEGRPRFISPRYLRRPLRAVGPWEQVPTDG